MKNSPTRCCVFHVLVESTTAIIATSTATEQNSGEGKHKDEEKSNNKTDYKTKLETGELKFESFSYENYNMNVIYGGYVNGEVTT